MSQFLEFFTFSRFMTVVYFLNFIISMAIIFLERKNPAATLAWILVLFVVPVAGIFLYLVFSQNISRRHIFKLSPLEEETVDRTLASQISYMESGLYQFPNDSSKKWEHMVKLNQTYGQAYLTENNEIELLTDGKLKYHRLMQDIRRAKKTINIEYFIVKNDITGLKLIDLLAKKAAEGVEVRLLMDAMGSRMISERRMKELKKSGGQYAFFFKPLIKFLFIRFNYRNHRKIVTIDDEIGYIGGFNIGKEYLGMNDRFGYWRDTHIRIKGDSLVALNQRFYLDWRYASKEEFNITDMCIPDGYEPGKKIGDTPVQIVSCGPDSRKQEIKQGLLRMVAYAKKNIYIQTPYFVPDSSLFDSIYMAAMSGVDVSIMIPCMPDHAFVYFATLSYVEELLEAGVKVYIYENGFLHAKTMVVDGEVATVGSANFDRRSFILNFEANAFIYKKEFAEEMESKFKEDVKFCRELTLEDYQKRGIVQSTKESISRLLSDVL
ncbi:MAG: cardiolipin synthase [Peptostreptococcaceae bacterium]|nr:cardiolipin synthase [Peptostreptococcaceae bacterium]